MLTAYDVANWLIYKLNGLNEDISPLKLQKLLYYTQGISFRTTGKALFENEFENWPQGPVVSEIYHNYPNHTYDSIEFNSTWMELKPLTDLQGKIINKTIQLFGDISAWDLRNMTHNEDPWSDTSKGDIISKEMIKEFFESQFDGIDLNYTEPLEYNEETIKALDDALENKNITKRFKSMDEYLKELMADGI